MRFFESVIKILYEPQLQQQQQQLKMLNRLKIFALTTYSMAMLYVVVVPAPSWKRKCSSKTKYKEFPLTATFSLHFFYIVFGLEKLTRFVCNKTF